MMLAFALGDPVSASGARNVWVQSGARSWRPCVQATREAEAGRFSAIAQAHQGHGWRKLAEGCPHEPWVALMAAVEAFGELETLDWASDAAADYATVIPRHRRLLQSILLHLERAQSEALRRGERPPPQTSYLLARARFGLGMYGPARDAWEQAYRTRATPRWMLDRLGALLDMVEGRLQASVRRARLAWTDVGHEERLISGYVWALVLDRAGSPGAAQDALEALRREGTYVMARRDVEDLLPVHERLYLLALDRQAEGDPAGAMLLWKAYLQRPEPKEPERVAAHRHLAEVEVRAPSPARPLE